MISIYLLIYDTPDYDIQLAFVFVAHGERRGMNDTSSPLRFCHT
jgi:hypothetical protein